MAAFCFLAIKRRDQDYHAKLALTLLAEAEPKVIQKQMDEWEKDA